MLCTGRRVAASRGYVLPFEVHAVSKAPITALCRETFEAEYRPKAFAPNVLARDEWTHEELLSECRMIAPDGSGTPTVPGLLTKGKMPTEWIPHVWIR